MPLVIPLAVLTFFGGFIPIIGAFVAGAFAVLIALVSNGFTTALIVLGIVLLVQQIEGNVLQPIIQGRGFNLHAGVVILAVTAGSSLAGIIGAFLSVPIAALIAVVYRYVRDELDGRSPEVAPDGTQARIRGRRGRRRDRPGTGHDPGRPARDAAGQRPADLTPRGGTHGNAAGPAAAAPVDVRTDPGRSHRGPATGGARRAAPRGRPLPRPRGRRRRAGRARRAWCWCTTSPATSTPRTPVRWPAPTCWPAAARGDRPVRRRQPRRLPRAPAADDVQRRPLRGLRGAGDRALRRWRTTPACRSCCCTAPSPTTPGSGSSPPSPQLVERLGVTSVVALQAIPMPVPHTRPVTVTAHATRRQLIEPYPVYWGEMRIPGSVSALLELRLGEAGRRRPGRGRARAALPGPGHLPGRLADPARAPGAADRAAPADRGTGARPPQANRTEIDEQIGRSSENTAVVAALEQQYDAFTAAREGTDLLGSSGEVPSAEEIGAEFERFLADQDRRRPRE